MSTKLYQKIAREIDRKIRGKQQNNTKWSDDAEEVLEDIMRNKLPSGSGIDAGTKLDDDSTPNRLVFHVPFHHLNDAGYYDGWTQHRVIVTASLSWGINIKVTGKDKNGIKDYLGELFHEVLTQEVS